jgi:hypothetical protein
MISVIVMYNTNVKRIMRGNSRNFYADENEEVFWDSARNRRSFAPLEERLRSG